VEGNKIFLIFALAFVVAFSYQTAEAGSSPNILTIDSNGGACGSLGTWNQPSLTCTMTHDLFMNQVRIASPGITLDGNGWALRGEPDYCFLDTYNGIHVDNVDNVTIKDVEIFGYINGIYLDNADDGTILDVLSHNNCDHGLILENASFRNDVSKSEFFRNGDDNILLRDSNNNEFDDIDANDSDSDDGIDLERSDNNKFTKFNAVGNNNEGVDLGDGSDGNTFSDGNINSNHGEGILIVNSDNNKITKNGISNNDNDGIEFENGSDKNNISENIISENDDEGIDLDGGNTGNTFTKNLIFSNESTGIELSDEDNDNTFTENDVNNNGDEGIELLNESSGNTFTKNHIEGNADSAFDIEGNSDNNTFSCNTVIRNAGAGFELEDSSSGNAIFKNHVEQNGEGIGLYSGAWANEITNNNIVRNQYQVFDDGGGVNTLSPNHWGDDVPSEDSDPLLNPVDLEDCKTPDLPEPEPPICEDPEQFSVFYDFNVEEQEANPTFAEIRTLSIPPFPGSEDWSGFASLESVRDYTEDGFDGEFLRNTSTGNPASKTTLTLTDLPEHSTIDIEFLLAIIATWDGTEEGCCNPDYFNVLVDGETIFKETFAHPPRTDASYIPAPGVLLEPLHKNRGFHSWDQAYDMGNEPAFKNIAHSSDTLTIDFFASGGGWQGGNDESWAIENVQVTTNLTPLCEVPEPEEKKNGGDNQWDTRWNQS
jgi:parallel beta-helix repeat protein